MRDTDCCNNRKSHLGLMKIGLGFGIWRKFKGIKFQKERIEKRKNKNKNVL